MLGPFVFLQICWADGTSRSYASGLRDYVPEQFDIGGSVVPPSVPRLKMVSTVASSE